MANFNISNNQFHDGSSMFGQYSEYNFNWDKLKHDVVELDDKLSSSDSLKPAVTELSAVIEKKEPGGVKQIITKYGAEFTTATFAGLATEAVKALVKVFLL